MDKAITYLRRQQNDDGSWGKTEPEKVGATGLITNSVGVRFDVRHLRSLTNDASSGQVGRRIAYTRFTIGLLLRLWRRDRPR